MGSMVWQQAGVQGFIAHHTNLLCRACCGPRSWRRCWTRATAAADAASHHGDPGWVGGGWRWTRSCRTLQQRRRAASVEPAHTEGCGIRTGPGRRLGAPRGLGSSKAPFAVFPYTPACRPVLACLHPHHLPPALISHIHTQSRTPRACSTHRPHAHLHQAAPAARYFYDGEACCAALHCAESTCSSIFSRCCVVVGVDGLVCCAGGDVLEGGDYKPPGSWQPRRYQWPVCRVGRVLRRAKPGLCRPPTLPPAAWLVQNLTAVRLQELSDMVGASERLITTPIPLSYTRWVAAAGRRELRRQGRRQQAAARLQAMHPGHQSSRHFHSSGLLAFACARHTARFLITWLVLTPFTIFSSCGWVRAREHVRVLCQSSATFAPPH